jgi:histidinol-phosphate aminotransferase
MGVLDSLRPDVREMTGYVPGEQPRTGKVIKLNTNENPYPPSPAVVRAIAAAAEGGLQRYPDPSASGFRMRAAQVLGVDPDWILCGNGSDDILTITTRAFVGQGERLRLPYPSYVLYKTLAKLQGAEAEEVLFEQDWSLPDRFGHMEPGLKLVFLPNPNSPSGTVIAPERILELARSLTCPLLVDEAYVDFAETHCVDLVRQSENIIVSRTLSKSYGLAGLRFGYCVAQPHVIEQLAKVKDSYNCDALSIAGATAAIDDQTWLHENRAKILEGRSWLFDALTRIGFTCVPSQANFVWATWPGRPLKPLYEKLRDQQVFVRHMNYAAWGEGLRISVGTPDQLDACVSILERTLKSN